MRFRTLLDALCLAALLAPSPTGAVDRPNIIFLMADDMGWGDAGCYGQKEILTPNIDRLAAQGIRFTDVYAGASVCAPSRSVLMTGQHTGHTRVRGNAGTAGGVGPERRVPLAPDDVTVAMLLKQAGYTTGIAGKWGLGEPGTTGVPNNKGFDEWFGYLNQKHAHDYYPEYLWKNTERVPLPGNVGGKQNQYSHDLIAGFSLEFVRRHRHTPFFLYLAWTLPHGKYLIPSLGAYAARDWPHDYQVHAAMVTLLDRDLGRLLDLLDELGLDDKTLLLFCSDNGGVERREGVLNSVGPFRGKKGALHEGGLRVPMIARWPGRIRAGQTSDVPWYFADVLPTLCAVAGAPPPAPGRVDGISVLPALLGEPQPALLERPMYWEQYSGGFRQATRLGRWKAHLTVATDRFELYDVKTDALEEHDVASRHPDIARRLREVMRAAHVPSPNWPVSGAAANARKRR